MTKLGAVEIKAFLPAKDFELSKQFYEDLGFDKKSDSGGVAYFSCGNCSFLLQEYYEKGLAENLMMHLLVKDVYTWHEHVTQTAVADKYDARVSEVAEQPWGMLDFVVFDPSGVLWRIAQNI